MSHRTKEHNRPKCPTCNARMKPVKTVGINQNGKPYLVQEYRCPKEGKHPKEEVKA